MLKHKVLEYLTVKRVHEHEPHLSEHNYYDSISAQMFVKK